MVKVRFCDDSSACEVFPIKLFLTATCVCVHLMCSRVEWDGGMSAMNTFFTQLIRKCLLITSHPAHEYTFCSSLSLCDVCFVLEHLVFSVFSKSPLRMQYTTGLCIASL